MLSSHLLGIQTIPAFCFQPLDLFELSKMGKVGSCLQLPCQPLASLFLKRIFLWCSTLSRQRRLWQESASIPQRLSQRATGLHPWSNYPALCHKGSTSIIFNIIPLRRENPHPIQAARLWQFQIRAKNKAAFGWYSCCYTVTSLSAILTKSISNNLANAGKTSIAKSG